MKASGKKLHDRAMHRIRFIAGIRCTRVTFLACFALFVCNNSKQQEDRLNTFQEEIIKLREGKKFRGPVDMWLSEGKPDPVGLKVLSDALKNEEEPVRKLVAKVLFAIGKRVDALYLSGGDLVRDEKIIGMIVEYGIDRPGQARDACLDLLCWSVPKSHLQAYGNRLVDNLRQMPDESVFLLIAKDKPDKAKKMIDELALSPQWATNEELAAAHAALGDEKSEARFINEFLETKNPERKARLATLLGFIGTEKSMTALAGEMRTDMIIKMVNVYKRSVRLDIIAGLRLVHADQPILFENAVKDDAVYEKIELFCERTYGTTWKVPRPPFLTVQGFPSQPPG